MLKLKWLLILSACAITLIKGFYGNEKNPPFTSITSYNEVACLLAKLDDKALVLFDVDDTLITSHALNKNYLSWWFKLLFSMRHPYYATMNWELYYSKMWKYAEFNTIEPIIVDLMHRFKNQDITLLALTSMETGSYGVISNMPKWRYHILKELGIEFSQHYGNITFTQFPYYRKNYPQLKHGILCANQEDKGKVLRAFLEHTQLKPSKIVAFDDNIGALKSIKKECLDRNIPFYGYHYAGSQLEHENWDLLSAMEQFYEWINKN